jgi:hypothetical protein
MPTPPRTDYHLARLTDSSLAELVAAPWAVLVLTRSDCRACATYVADLARRRDEGALPGVAIGTLALDAPDGERFKRANPGLTEVDFLPYTLLYTRGRVAEQFATTHADYLVGRLYTPPGRSAPDRRPADPTLDTLGPDATSAGAVP